MEGENTNLRVLGESNKLEAQPSLKRILSQPQEHIYEEDNHQESCSWARTRQEINLKSNWSEETIMETQEQKICA